MWLAIQEIDRAIKKVYNLHFPYFAEDFLVDSFPTLQNAHTKVVGNANFQGALLIDTAPSPLEEDESLHLGIYLSRTIRKELAGFNRWTFEHWSPSQLAAFTVAVEEVSHFHYYVHRALFGQSVSQLELELQGEIDKFLLAYFAAKNKEDAFEILFDKIFYHFRLIKNLTPEQELRYIDANRFARRFILKVRDHLNDASKFQHVLRLLRRFYRINSAEKIGLIIS